MCEPIREDNYMSNDLDREPINAIMKPTWEEIRDDEPIYSPEEGDGRKSDVWDWALFGWPMTIGLAMIIIFLYVRFLS